MNRLLVATRSTGKLSELRPLLAEAGYVAIDLGQAGIAEAPNEAAIEAHETFEANALAKARHFHGLSGLPTVADDSGLEVSAIGGLPGVRSKRWSERPDLTGPELDASNNLTLSAMLDGQTDRSARYVCAASFVDDALECIVRGETTGVILLEPRGSGGFGYDPYFESDELGRTFAEATIEEKARVSHRGRAFRALLARLGEQR